MELDFDNKKLSYIKKVFMLPMALLDYNNDDSMFFNTIRENFNLKSNKIQFTDSKNNIKNIFEISRKKLNDIFDLIYDSHVFYEFSNYIVYKIVEKLINNKEEAGIIIDWQLTEELNLYMLLYSDSNKVAIKTELGNKTIEVTYDRKKILLKVLFDYKNKIKIEYTYDMSEDEPIINIVDKDISKKIIITDMEVFEIMIRSCKNLLEYDGELPKFINDMFIGIMEAFKGNLVLMDDSAQNIFKCNLANSFEYNNLGNVLPKDKKDNKKLLNYIKKMVTHAKYNNLVSFNYEDMLCTYDNKIAFADVGYNPDNTFTYIVNITIINSTIDELKKFMDSYRNDDLLYGVVDVFTFGQFVKEYASLHEHYNIITKAFVDDYKLEKKKFSKRIKDYYDSYYNFRSVYDILGLFKEEEK